MPTGTVTFVFTDIEGSTRVLRELGSERYGAELDLHRERVRRAIAAHRGFELGTEGDAFFVAFERASDALGAAGDVQAALADGPVRVRIGIHTGEPLIVGGNYVGLDVHKAARICAAAHGGQVLVSQATRDLAEAELRDLGEHSLKDMTVPERLFQLGTTDFPPLSTVRATNLPSQPTPLIGRAGDLDAVCRLLADPTARLVTLVGPGGVGKTRLAVAVADRVDASFAGGARWVALAGVAVADQVGATIADALGVIPAPGEGAGQALTRYVAGNQLLLVIDNFEHLLDAAELVAELLRGCDELKVLTTSREALDLTGEHRFRVAPLALPPSTEELTVADLESADATVLFLAAARRRDQHFELTPANASLIAQICSRLEGLPLALELAAARAGALGVDELAATLKAAVSDLGTGPRDAPARQRTLRATIDWSYRLLADDEARTFARFAVFAGGATLDPARAVTGAARETLEALIAKSLIESRIEVGGQSRLVMLETIREFAVERLADDPEHDDVRRLHAEWYLTLAQQADERLRSPDQAVWFSRLDAEIDNLRAALAWSLEKDIALGVELASALFRLWRVHGQLRELITWLERALANPKATDRRTRAVGLTAYGTALMFAGKGAPEGVDRTAGFARAESALEESLRLFRELADRTGEANALKELGYVVWMTSGQSPERAVSLLEAALAIYREVGDQDGIEHSLARIGDCLFKRGDLDLAAARFEESLAITAELGDLYGMAPVAHSLGDVALDLGDRQQAAQRYREALQISTDIGDSFSQSACIRGLACVAALDGDSRSAGRLWAAAEAVERRVGDERLAAHELRRYEQIIMPVTGDPRFQEGQAAGRKLPLDQVVDEITGR